VVNKQLYLTDDQVSGVREIVNDLIKNGASGTLKGAAVKNISEPLADSRYLKDQFMSTEQAWVTAVVSHLISSGYEIKKRSNEG
jgi:hypothetical protein